ncbi:TrmH family RNA methyltransferase [Breznakiella homolactica]|uniref:RNA methyltransferase n=1 Tax=Breznakiella homolactica TaxID=2798577 RepID=A0A7T7XP12_9SPIR|nr:RNA methyltransferase [Breznakiella homolactica]QQO09763.1 RNA methyltransferase [Breznakiella homolactica]
MRNKLTNELAVCGFNAVHALGEFHPEQINRLFLREDRLPAFTKVCKQLAEEKRPYKLCEDEELERLCKSPRHQGVVAMIEEPVIRDLTAEELDRWAREGKTGLLLSSVGNDNNLGAIIRSAAFFDASFIILSDGDREARLTTSAYRVAEGGMEHVEVRKVRRPEAFVRDAAKKLVTIGADHRSRLRIRDINRIIGEERQKLQKKQSPGGQYVPGILLAVGNEERGLAPGVREHCAILARIPGTGNIESLNVAQAATLFLHEIFES